MKSDMKVITWNMKNATFNKNESWDYLMSLNTNIALLQEVNSIPEYVYESFDVLFEKATNYNSKIQNFGCVILVKGKIIKRIGLNSKLVSVNRNLQKFNGNFLSAKVQIENGKLFNVVCVHSPHWSISKEDFTEDEISKIKLKNNQKIWGTELFWSALLNQSFNENKNWIVGGDFNASQTFDFPKNRGNQEFLDRMKAISFEECLFISNGKLIPTFKHSSHQIKHQIDHIFVTPSLLNKLENCVTGNKEDIFDTSLSDHLPIIADFKI